MLRVRVITALVMLAGLLAVTTVLPPFHFALITAGILLIAITEWTGLMGLNLRSSRLAYGLLFSAGLALLAVLAGLHPQATVLHRQVVLLACGSSILFWLLVLLLFKGYPGNRDRWSTPAITGVMGVFTLMPTWLALVQLKYLGPQGFLVLALVALVSIADIGAFFVGRAWGRRKLAPRLSPQKSWAGFWGGMISALTLGALLLFLLHRFVQALHWSQVIALLLLALVVAAFSVAGDLFESMLKRSQGLKDSGNLLPGHGGVLDRIDSLTAAAPLFAFSLMILLEDVVWS